MGVKRGIVLKVPAPPVGLSEMPDITLEDLDSLVSAALRRRTNMSWESLGKHMGEHLEEQANKQAGRQARKQGSRQALGVHSVRAMPWRGLLVITVSISINNIRIKYTTPPEDPCDFTETCLKNNNFKMLMKFLF